MCTSTRRASRPTSRRATRTSARATSSTSSTFPEIIFRSTKIEKTGNDYRVSGDLTIRGVTRPVVLDAEYAGSVTDPYGNTRAGFAARTSVDRKEFGLMWNVLLEAGGFAVGDKVDIAIEFEAVKQKAAVPREGRVGSGVK